MVGGTQDGPNQPPPEVIFQIMDLPALRDEHARVPGYYVAAAGADQRLPWRGAVLYDSIDGTTFREVRQITREAHMGRITAAPSGSVSSTSWDRASTITVEMLNGTLSTATEIETLNGANRAALFSSSGRAEVIAFANATLTSSDPNTYDLTKLLRGMLNTETLISGHAVGDWFVVLDGPGIEFVEVNQVHVNQPRTFKCASHYGVLEEFAGRSFTVLGRNVTPFAVTRIRGTRDGSDNLTITWDRRTRAQARILSPTNAPVWEDEGQLYEVDIIEAQNVLRTITVTAETASYTAAEQTADGLTPGNPVSGKIYQRSNLIGRGRAATFTV